MSILKYNILDDNDDQIGTAYVTGCTDVTLIDKLDYYVAEGFRFYQALTAMFYNAARFEFMQIVDANDINLQDQTTVVLPWNLVYKSNDQ